MDDLGKIVITAKTKSDMHGLIDALTDEGSALLLIDDLNGSFIIRGLNGTTNMSASYMLQHALHIIHRGPNQT